MLYRPENEVIWPRNKVYVVWGRDLGMRLGMGLRYSLRERSIRVVRTNLLCSRLI